MQTSWMRPNVLSIFMIRDLNFIDFYDKDQGSRFSPSNCINLIVLGWVIFIAADLAAVNAAEGIRNRRRFTREPN